MFTAITEDLTILTVAFGIAILAWGFFRAKPFGKLGILAWLQSVVLMIPWLLFFGLAAGGVMLNLAVILVLLVISTVIYIGLGNRVRSLKQELLLSRKAAAMAKAQEKAPSVISQDASNGDIDPAELKLGQPSAALESKGEPEAATDDGLPLEPEFVPIPAEDLKRIQGIFGIDTFFVTETIPYQEGAIFRGNLRAEPEDVYARLSESLHQRMGDRYRLFLMQNQDEKPVAIVLPTSRDPQPLSLVQKLLASFLLVLTLGSCLESAGFMLGFDLFDKPNRWAETLPLGLGLMGVLLAHELGHWLMAKRHQVRLSWPFFIPTIQIGSFGAITRFESVLPNRNVLFDVSFAGPAAGGLLSLGILVTGLLLSHKGSLFQLPSQFFQGSILVGTLARVVLPESLQQPIVDVHPLVVLGWLGLVITALNLMPAGQLDGGRIVQAIYGRAIARRTTIGTLIILGLAALVNPLALYWALLVFLVQREQERPNLNELTEPDDARAALGLLALFLMVVTLLPLTPSLAGHMGIGNP